MTARPGQLPLALTVAAHARLETFVAGGNAAAVRHVRELAAGRHEIVWLWGGRGCGKTHLLQAACWVADRAGKRAMYLPIAPGGVPDMLRGLETIEMLALDTADTVAGAAAWEAELFTLVNAFMDGNGALVIASRTAPAAAGYALPDLASRAAGSATYRLEPLDDADQVAALIVQAQARGLDLDRAAAEYLQQRVTRDMHELVAWLDRLDRASLAEQRRLTVPFIRAQLASRG